MKDGVKNEVTNTYLSMSCLLVEVNENYRVTLNIQNYRVTLTIQKLKGNIINYSKNCRVTLKIQKL